MSDADVHAAADALRDAMIANGTDAGTAEALVYGARPSMETKVGSLADLQKYGHKLADLAEPEPVAVAAPVAPEPAPAEAG